MTHEVLRLAALARDGHCCTECGKSDSLQIHHVIPIKRGGDDLLENLRTLCVGCHRKIEPPIPKRAVTHNVRINTSTTIKIGKKTRDRLQECFNPHGGSADTYDSVINRLIDQSNPKSRGRQ